MSKIGQYNLELQEQAEELGFSTTQEALDAGFTVDYTAKEPTLVFDNDKAYEQAHAEWEREKDILLRALRETKREAEDAGRDMDACVIKNAIEFIEKGDM